MPESFSVLWQWHTDQTGRTGLLQKQELTFKELKKKEMKTKTPAGLNWTNFYDVCWPQVEVRMEYVWMYKTTANQLAYWQLTSQQVWAANLAEHCDWPSKLPVRLRTCRTVTGPSVFRLALVHVKVIQAQPVKAIFIRYFLNNPSGRWRNWNDHWFGDLSHPSSTLSLPGARRGLW